MLASSIFRRPSAILQNRPDPRPLILISTSTDDEGSAKVTGGLVRDSASSPGNLIGVATVSPIDSERSWYPTPKKFASFAARRRRAAKLANFFGVGYHDLSESMGLTEKI